MPSFDFSLLGDLAVFVVRLAGHFLDPFVEQSAAGAGVAGDDFVVLAEPGDVGHAAQVEDHGRPRLVGEERAVEHADERRALAADGDVVAAEIAHHAHAGLLGEQPGVADLPTDLLAGDVPHGVAVEADEIAFLRDSRGNVREQLGDGFGVVQRDVALDAGQLEQRHVVLRGFEHACAQLAVVGQGEAAEELDGVLAVGGDERDVGAVGRRAAHQARELFVAAFLPRAHRLLQIQSWQDLRQ